MHRVAALAAVDSKQRAARGLQLLHEGDRLAGIVEQPDLAEDWDA